MSFLSSIFRCMCLCLVIQRGSWNPNSQNIIPPNQNKAIKGKVQTSSPKKKQLTLPKPEWLKEWTISKGWVHNKSHLLELGRKKQTDMDYKKFEELSDTSSVSIENVDELISIKSTENAEDSKKLKNTDDDSSIQEEGYDASKIYQEISKNYRDNFPICSHALKQNTNMNLPEIYKERLLMTKNNHSLFSDIWNFVKSGQKKKLDLNNCKFTVNRLYEDTTFLSSNQEQNIEEQNHGKRNNLGRNIALFNTLNAKTNLHEDTIYECSDENSNYNSLNNIYLNPIYAPLPVQKFENFKSNHEIELFNKTIALQNYQENLKLITKKEKYVIRHIKVRFMLSLRLGKFQKINKKPRINRKTCFRAPKKEKIENKSDDIKMRVAKIHQEQKRIGNGKVSVKIQNMRYGRLNVLRWLLWEAESRDNMPALEKVAANNTTLALHYAAARGCLDCVRLLVDSSPDLRYFEALSGLPRIDKEKSEADQYMMMSNLIKRSKINSLSLGTTDL